MSKINDRDAAAAAPAAMAPQETALTSDCGLTSAPLEAKRGRIGSAADEGYELDNGDSSERVRTSDADEAPRTASP